MTGTYRFCGDQHLQRYLNEFQFRYNNRSGLGISDGERTASAMKGIEGKRLTYRRLIKVRRRSWLLAKRFLAWRKRASARDS